MSQTKPPESHFADLGELLAGAGVSPDRVERFVREQLTDELHDLRAGLSRETGAVVEAQLAEAKLQVEREVQRAQRMLEELYEDSELARQTAQKCASITRLVIWLMVGHTLAVAAAIGVAFWYLC